MTEIQNFKPYDLEERIDKNTFSNTGKIKIKIKIVKSLRFGFFVICL